MSERDEMKRIVKETLSREFLKEYVELFRCEYCPPLKKHCETCILSVAHEILKEN